MAPPPVGRSSPTASPAPAPPPHHSLPLQRFRHQRHQHDLGAAVLGGFAEPEVIRARGDFRVCLDEVVGDLEAIGRRVGKGGHLRVPDFPHNLLFSSEQKVLMCTTFGCIPAGSVTWTRA